MLVVLPALLLLQSAPPPADTITAEEIRAFAGAPWDKRDRANRPHALGIHHGTPVIIQYRCSDVCPAYTTRVIRYAVEPGPDCDRIGGVTREATIPRGIASARMRFCVPAVLGNALIPLGGG